uniref:DNA-directed RNA polymerase RBP11-like dimerisation domain-containing protein n=1 Tax=Noctiluca scintillans TaxID=2966 RepID=A0A7S1EYA1_NOCSC|mmetsp:Transcript_17290/g.46867  ORF Transcript_17290/g.46867 Transcript_17290/m.46867 type:complete len:235 (+) Transcript_17290:87-791(+)
MATPGQLQMYNKMEVSEMFGLDHRAMDNTPGIEKIHRIHKYRDEKVPDAIIFHIWLEDHTLGNLLRMELLRNSSVLFVGYKVPHPLNFMIELRVQTLPKTTPEIAVRRAVRNLKEETKSMLDQFDRGVKQYQQREAAKLPILDALQEGMMTGDSDTSAPMQTSSAEFDEGGDSPRDEDRHFQEQLEQLERLGHTSTSFSPSYEPTSPATGLQQDPSARLLGTRQPPLRQRDSVP